MSKYALHLDTPEDTPIEEPPTPSTEYLTVHERKLNLLAECGAPLLYAAMLPPVSGKPPGSRGGAGGHVIPAVGLEPTLFRTRF